VEDHPPVSIPNQASRSDLLPPKVAEIEGLAKLEGIELRPGEVDDLATGIAAIVEFAERARDLEQPPLPRPQGHRDAGYRPGAEEDPFNVFIRKCRVEGASDGPLAGLTVGLKDNISVAEIPTTNGAHMPAYTPNIDAVVVERILAAGGTIVGKLNMDEFGGGATGELSAFGPARNPVDPAYSAGGSSGGSGAAVRAGAVDLALGVDQGGSGRVPAACCGVVAVKATHGLVPTFGVTHIDHTIDFVTPIARTVHGAAVLLEVIAGDDWRDPQWVRGPIPTAPYTRSDGEGIAGLRIGIVDESMTGIECEPEVVEGVDRVAEALAAAGAVVERISVPIWRCGFTVFAPYVAHVIANMFRSEGEGYGHLGVIDVGRMRSFAAGRRAESWQLNPYLKMWLLADRYLHERYLNVTYGELHNLRLGMRRTISRVLDEWDLLLTPTLPVTAPRLAAGAPTIAELLSNAPASIAYNTSPLNLTGHPAISVPSGANRRGLPTAAQIFGRHFSEYTVFRAAFAVERALGPFVRED
jgi:amidase